MEVTHFNNARFMTLGLPLYKMSPLKIINLDFISI
jgi:hypothetical protein